MQKPLESTPANPPALEGEVPFIPETATPLSIGIALATIYIIWGSSFLAIRLAIADFPPFLMSGTRYMIAGVILYAFVWLRSGETPRLREWIAAFIAGLFLVVTANGGLVFAEQTVTSGLAAMGFATAPMWAVLIAAFWERWPTRAEWISLGFGFAGVVMLNLETDLSASPLGAIVLMISAMGWGFGSIISRRVSLPVGLMGSAATMLCGGLTLTLFGFAVGERLNHFPALESALAFGYLSIFSSLIGFSAYNFLMRNTRPAVFTSHAYTNPVVAVALGAVVEHERFNWLECVAMAMTVAALFCLTLQKQRASGTVVTETLATEPEP
ncbi:MAG TPA: drug/metabolite exporter YedA [Candidatus Binataceae bacterium]|nr:drug/metabolite exporter YedA [Candidatus Binataceae bacterium]